MVVPTALVTTAVGFGAKNTFHLTTDFINDPSTGYHAYSPEGGTIYFGASAHNIDAAAANAAVYTKYATVKTSGTNNPKTLEIYKSNKDDKYYILVDGEYKECEYVNYQHGGTYKYGTDYFTVDDMVLEKTEVPSDYKPYAKGRTDDETIYYNESDGQYYAVSWNGKEYDYIKLLPQIAHLPEAPDGTPAQDVITGFMYPDNSFKNITTSELLGTEETTTSITPTTNTPASIKYDFSFDKDKITSVITKLSGYTSMIDDNIESIYRLIESVGKDGAWTGTVYNQFNSSCQEYRKVFDDYVDVINEYIKSLQKISDQAVTFSENIKAAKSNYNGIINIAAGKAYTINELYQIISEVLKTDIKPEYLDPRPGDIKHSYASVENMDKINFKVDETKFKEQLKETVNWFKETYNK